MPPQGTDNAAQHRANSHHPHRQPAADAEGGGPAAAEHEEPGAHRAALEAAVADAVTGVVEKQKAAGIDVINDGEQGRTDYTVHVIDRLTGFEGTLAPPRGTGEPEFPGACATAQPVRVAVSALAGVLGTGDVEGLASRRGRYRASQGGDEQGWRRGIVHDLAVAGPDRSLSREPALQDRRGISVRAGRRDGARVSRHRRGRLRAAARLPRSRDVLCALSRHQHRGLPQDHLAQRRSAEPFDQGFAGRPDAHARVLGLDARPASWRHPDQGHRRYHPQGQAAGGVVPRRQSTPRPRMEGLAGREAAGRQDHHPGRDRFDLELRRASRAGGRPHPAIRAAWSAARTSSPASTAASAPLPAGSRSTPRSSG